MNWINAEDKRPNLDEMVLIYMEYEDIKIYPEKANIIRLAKNTISLVERTIEKADHAFSEYIIIPSGEKIRGRKVKYWMPLPQPPKETE